MTKAEDAAQADKDANSEFARAVAKAIAKTNGHPNPDEYADAVQEQFDAADEE